MRLEIINVGEEVLRAETLEDNGRFLSGALSRQGLAPSRLTVVGDDMEAIASEIGGAMARSDVVIVTGGLGPTVDDLTRRAAIEALGGEVDVRGDIVEGIERKFRGFGRVMPEGYRDLARLPRGAEVLDNPAGAAPGLMVRAAGGMLFLLPGVPGEMKAIFEESVLPRLEGSERSNRSTLRIFGMMETEAEEIARSVLGPGRTERISLISGVAGISLHIPGGEATEGEMKLLRERFGSYIYTSCDSSMEEEVLALLGRKGLTLAVAESLTGGLLASTIVSVPGASDSFMEGYVTYSNEAKVRSLGVDGSDIMQHGAVSREVCIAMARGARSRAGTDTALSTTGIAGPAGGSEEKPVGLCYAGLDTPDGTWCSRMQLPGTREQVRTRVVYRCLDMLRLFLSGEKERLDRIPRGKVER